MINLVEHVLKNILHKSHSGLLPEWGHKYNLNPKQFLMKHNFIEFENYNDFFFFLIEKPFIQISLEEFKLLTNTINRLQFEIYNDLRRITHQYSISKNHLKLISDSSFKEKLEEEVYILIGILITLNSLEKYLLHQLKTRQIIINYDYNLIRVLHFPKIDFSQKDNGIAFNLKQVNFYYNKYYYSFEYIKPKWLI